MASTIVSALSAFICGLALILCSCPADAQKDLAMDCCLTFSYKHIPKPIVLSYRLQTKGEGCPIDAVVVTTKRGRHLCAPPAKEARWVGDLLNFVDVRFINCKDNKFQGKRCEDLKK